MEKGNQYKDVAIGLHHSGLEVIPVEGKRPVGTGWQNTRDSTEEIERKSANGSGDLNVGVLCGLGGNNGVVGVDIDVTDDNLARLIIVAFLDKFDKGRKCPVRIGSAPKALIIVHCEESFSKRKISIWVKGIKHQIEILSKGQQFVGYGVHPDTGVNYRYTQNPLAEVDTKTIPKIDRNELDSWLTKALPSIIHDNGTKIERVKFDGFGDAASVKSDDDDLGDFSEVELPREFTTRQVIDMLKQLSPDMMNDEWVKVGMALKSWDKEEGLELWEKWSKNGNTYADGECGKRWKSFNRTDIGIGTLKFMADGGEAGLKERTENSKALTDNWIYITQKNKYFNVSNRTAIIANAFDRLLKPDFPGGKAGMLASNAFDSNTDKRVAHDIGWMPVDDLLINIEGLDYCNTYKGLAVEPIRNDELVKEWLALMRLVWGEYHDLVEAHMAYTVKYPDEKIRWQPLCIGATRTGKSMSVRPLIQIFGEAGKSIDPDELAGGWGNMWAKRKVVVLEEIYVPGDKGFFNRLKPKFSNNDIEGLSIKGEGVLTQPNLYSIYGFSNEEDCLHLHADEDKVLVVDGPTVQQRWSKERYTALGSAIDKNRGVNPTISAILWYLLNAVELEGTRFSPAVLPVRTAAMLRMAEHSKTDYEMAIEEMIEDGSYPFNRSSFKYEMVHERLKKMGYKFGRKGVFKALKNGGFKTTRAQRKVDKTNLCFRVWVSENDTRSAREIFDDHDDDDVFE